MASSMQCKHAYIHIHNGSAKQLQHGEGDNHVKNCNSIRFHEQSHFKNMNSNRTYLLKDSTFTE